MSPLPEPNRIKPLLDTSTGLIPHSADPTNGNALEGSRGSSQALILRFLAVFDTLTLWSYVVWDIAHYFYTGPMPDLFCKCLIWIMASAPHVASHCLLAMTVERMLAVIYPLQVRKIFSNRNALIFCLVISLLPFCYNSLYFVVMETRNKGYNYCGLNQAWEERLRYTWFYFDVTIGVISPAALVLILNIITTVAYRRALSKSKLLVASNNSRKYKHSNGVMERGGHLTAMLLTVSLTYWVLMLPSGIAVIVDIHVAYPHSYFIDKMAYLLMLTNNAVNFLLYLVSGTKFRYEMKSLCSKTQSRSLQSQSFTAFS